MLTDLMVDLETTGTNPEHNAIIQIAAVKFDPVTLEVSSDVFDKTLAGFPPNRFWEEGGRQFWQKMPQIYQSLIERAEPIEKVLDNFVTYLLKDEPEGGWRLWAKPITFEWGFLSSYFRQYDRHIPFHYRYCRDLNSYVAGLRGTPEHFNFEDVIPFEGDEHNALWDCFHQIKQLFYAIEKWEPVNGQTNSPS
jgi:oligoribonuclease (3'-5' exoribonuclease)